MLSKEFNIILFILFLRREKEGRRIVHCVVGTVGTNYPENSKSIQIPSDSKFRPQKGKRAACCVVLKLWN